MKLLSDMNIDKDKLGDINNMGEEDEFDLSNGIVYEKNQHNHFSHDQHKHQQNHFVANQDDNQDDPNVDNDNKNSVYDDVKGIKLFRITNLSYAKMVAVVIVVLIVKILMAATPIMRVTVIQMPHHKN